MDKHDKHNKPGKKGKQEQAKGKADAPATEPAGNSGIEATPKPMTGKKTR